MTAEQRQAQLQKDKFPPQLLPSNKSGFCSDASSSFVFLLFFFFRISHGFFFVNLVFMSVTVELSLKNAQSCIVAALQHLIMPALPMTDRKLPQTGVSSAINLKRFSAAVYIYTGKITTNYSPVLVCNGIPQRGIILIF